MKIAIIGTGYVGLTTGACFAEAGNTVLCMDIDSDKIENLKKGIIPIYESGLKELVKKHAKQGGLRFTTSVKEAVQFAEIVFCAVGTPQGKDHKADLVNVKTAAEEFGRHINSYKIFVNKSTVPVGTGSLCEKMIHGEIKKRGMDINFDIISNPEFLREGSAVNDTFLPDRIIIGAENSEAAETVKALYRKTIKNNAKILCTDIKSAEIIKYAANAMLATKISFVNEIANFCEKAGGNIKTVAEGIGLDKRIGKGFLNAGIGYGGSCLPKDVKALIQTGKDYGYNFKIIKSVDDVNTMQKEVLIRKLKKQLGSLECKKIAVWGLSFKPETDDMRSAPSLTVIKKLQAEGAYISAYDPVAVETAQKIIEPFNITFAKTAYEAAKGAEALLILTEWEEFKKTDLKKLKSLMKNALLLDGRNIFTPEKVEKEGFQYASIGRRAVPGFTARLKKRQKSYTTRTLSGQGPGKSQ